MPASCQSPDPATLPGYTPGAQVLPMTPERPRIDEVVDVAYAQVLGPGPVRQLRLSLLVPRTGEAKPLVVYFPGGGFLAADRGRYVELRLALASRGFVVAAAEYRTVPATFPALVQDGKAAVRFLRAHAATWGIDPSRVGVLGHSAGGYVAQMLGLTCGDPAFEAGDHLDQSSDVQAVASVYGVSDLATIGEGFARELQGPYDSPAAPTALLLHGPAYKNHAGRSVRDDPAAALAASPMGHVGSGKPPFLLLHGSADTLVSPAQSARLYRALADAGNDVEYVLVPGADHGDINWYQEAVARRIGSWFERVLGTPGR